MTNHKQDIYRPTRDELRERGRTGGTVGGQRRHSGAKWRAVDAAVAACKSGVPTWDVLADFYDMAYRLGYGAQYNAARRRQKASEAA
jgi:hypothetical protein